MIRSTKAILSILQKRKQSLPDVSEIVNNVKLGKDKALFSYIKKFDSFNANKSSIVVNKARIKQAYKHVDKDLIQALREAKSNIESFAKKQVTKEWKQSKNGIVRGELVRPIEKVACYVPGGSFPLISSVLMTVIPAKVAGVREVVVATPPRANNDAMLVAADIAGVNKIYNMGGAHAIAALAYGTNSVIKVDKIVGPGNAYVTAAKKQVYGDVGIDFVAGPSEIVILAEFGNPTFIAADMLAQAEHDPNASSILVTTSKKLAKDTNGELKEQMKVNSDIAKSSIKNNGAIVLVKSLSQGINLVNKIAPEHLQIMVKDEDKVISKLLNFGALFIGEYSPEAAGDYITGPNHVLPTMGAARFTSGLSVRDFVRTPTVQKVSKNTLQKLKKSIATLAAAEGLFAHANSVNIRK